MSKSNIYKYRMARLIIKLFQDRLKSGFKIWQNIFLKILCPCYFRLTNFKVSQFRYGVYGHLTRSRNKVFKALFSLSYLYRSPCIYVWEISSISFGVRIKCWKTLVYYSIKRYHVFSRLYYGSGLK